MMSKEQEEQQRAYIPPDYSEAEKLCPTDEDDIEDVDLEDDDDIDDDDDFDEEEEEDDPAEAEEKLEQGSESGVFPSQPSPQPSFQNRSSFQQPQSTPFQRNQPFNNYNQQRNMATPTWPNTNPSPQGGFGGFNPSPGTNPGWGPKPGNSWAPSTGTTPGWSSGVGGQKEILDRGKKIVFCDVLDCLVTTLDSGNRLGVVPRGIYDIQLRLDVWAALRRFGRLERIYAMIPKSLILNSSGEDSWMALLNYVACALAEFLKIPSNSCQILTQSFVVQPKAEMIGSVLGDIDTEDVVYIGTQSGGLGQSSIDLDAANDLGIDYIDLGQFMTIYQ